jgi:hypothetical protein
MSLLEIVCRTRRIAITGGIAGVLSAAFIVAASVRETGSPASGINGASQAFLGRNATRVRRIDFRHTLTGLFVHHASALWWAGVHEGRRLREMVPNPCIRALLVMAGAGVLDYGVLPRRLSPGLEGQLSRRTIAATFGVIAAGLALGSWIQDRPLRLSASQVRKLLSGAAAERIPLDVAPKRAVASTMTADLARAVGIEAS